MGSGKQKAHEPFTIAPAPDVLDDHTEQSLPESQSSESLTPQSTGSSAAHTAVTQEADATAGPAEAVKKKCAMCGKPITDDDICSDCWQVASLDEAAAAVGSAASEDAQAPDTAELEEMLAQPAVAEPERDAAHATAPEADAEHEADWDDDDLLTPIPDELTVGDGIGTAVAVGGADLLDGAAILTSYKDPKGGPSHEVLRASLTPDAEDKLLDALSPPDAPKVPIQVPEVVSGRLPIDKDQQLQEELARAAKSINHHLKDGTAIPQHTLDRVASVDKKLEALQGTVAAGSAEHQMLQHYQDAVDQCKQRIAPGFNTPYTEGGKIPTVNAFEHTGEVMVTKMVPDPDFQASGLPVTKRGLSRISASYDNGVSTWDGSSRTPGSGTELAIDLGDGYQAVVRPTSLNAPGSSDVSLRGTLEITAPPGAGHQQQLLEKLGHLNIVNRPMNAAEAEWTYLQRNINAHGVDKHSAVTTAIGSATNLEDAHAHSLLMQRAPQAVGLDDAGLAQFARKLQLDAEADALPDKVRLLKEGVAKAFGHADGAAMAKAVSYDPRPRRDRGWLTWGRIGQSPSDLKPVLAGKAMVHRVTGGPDTLTSILTSGVLAPTERRRLMGIQAGLGMSESSDMKSGGASSVFLRIHNKTSSHGHDSSPRLIWNSPEKLLSRTDWYAYNGDHFGAAVAGTGYSISGQTRDPHKVAKFNGGGNEIMIAHGLDILEADAPDKVVCSASQRTSILAELAAAGVKTIGGRPVEKVVVTG